MKFSVKMWLMIILKVAKSWTSPSLHKTHFLKNHRGIKLTPSSIRVKLIPTLLKNTLKLMQVL